MSIEEHTPHHFAVCCNQVSDIMHALFGTHKDAALPFFEQLLPDFNSLLVSEIFDWRLCCFSLYFAYSTHYPSRSFPAIYY